MTEHIRPISQISPETTQIPNWLILRNDLTANERLLVIVLLMHAAQKESLSLTTLANLTGSSSVTRGAVRRR